MNLYQLGEQVAAWHAGRYPTATAKDVALKLAEEAGEVCGAVVERDHPSLHRDARALADELGDVIIACAALAARAGLDLDTVVHNRWQTVRARGQATT